MRILRRKKSYDSPGRVFSRDNTTKSTNASNIFSRNRTLVGSMSHSVASASESSSNLRSPRAHAHHLTFRRRRLLTVLSYVIVTVGVLTWFLYEFTAHIDIEASSSATVSSITVDSTRYQRAIGDYLNSHPFERLRPLMKTKELTNFVSSITPEVKRVSTRGSSGLASTRLEIQFRKPVAGWVINGKQYYVDKDGVSFQLNYFERPSVKIVDNSGVSQTSGSTVISGRFLRFVGRTVEIARGLGVNVEQAIIPSGTTRQVDVRVLGHNYPIKLSLDRSVGEQVEDMAKAITFFTSRKLEPLYIDVRVSGRAFYQI